MTTTLIRDAVHAAGWDIQATAGIYVDPRAWASWLVGPVDIQPNRPQATPAIQRYTRWELIQAFDTTIEVALNFEVIVDSWDSGYLLAAASGNDVYTFPGSVATHTFTPGPVTGSSVSIQPMLNMKVTTGVYTTDAASGAGTVEVYNFMNVRVTSIVPRVDPSAGPIMARVTAVAIYAGLSTVAAPSFTLTGKNPFVNSYTVVSRNSAALSVISGEIDITNKAVPIYGSPTTGVGGALPPVRFSEGGMGATADIIYDIAGPAMAVQNDSYRNFLAGTPDAWGVIFGSSAGNTLGVTLASVKYDTGSEDNSSDDTRQHISGGGQALATSSGASIVLTGGRTSAYSTYGGAY